MNRVSLTVPLALLCSVISSPVSAAVYYIHYTNGNDLADGATPGTPWQHAPGDPEATGKPLAAKLLPGDVVRFAGGVPYRGSIIAKFSGADGNPIIYAGTGYGTGSAIFEGSVPVTSITPCPSAAACHFAPA